MPLAGEEEGRTAELKFQFKSELARRAFESLVDSFLRDYMIKKIDGEKCGWRGISDIAKLSRAPVRAYYGTHGGISRAFAELVNRGVIETRYFPGERGRGGEVMRFRIAYETDHLRAYVDQRIRSGKVGSLQFQQHSISSVEPQQSRVAVLPFTNMSKDSSDAYIADGMTEELISSLAKVKGLAVISRTSVMKYKGAPVQVGDISRELHVGSVIEGSVRRSGNRVRVSAQLIDAGTDAHIWSQQYDRDMTNIFAIQSDIAERVTEALLVHLLRAERRELERKPTSSSEAHVLYLKGRFYLNERTKEDTDKALKYFEEATRLDPKFALALAGLADCHALYGSFGWGRSEVASEGAKSFALKALELDPRQAEARATLGLVYMNYDWNWSKAEEEFTRAIDLEPSNANAHLWYALLLDYSGRTEDAYDQFKKASELDPYSRGASAGFAWALLECLGKRREAIRQYREVIEADPDFAYAHDRLGMALYLDHKEDEALEELRRGVSMDDRNQWLKADFAIILALMGRWKEARALLGKLLVLPKAVELDADVGCVLFCLGRTEDAFARFEKAYTEKSIRLINILTLPWLGTLHKNPRWVSMQDRMGIRGR